MVQCRGTVQHRSPTITLRRALLRPGVPLHTFLTEVQMPHRPVPQYSSAQQVYLQCSQAATPLSALMHTSQGAFSTACFTAAHMPSIALNSEVEPYSPNSSPCFNIVIDSHSRMATPLHCKQW